MTLFRENEQVSIDVGPVKPRHGVVLTVSVVVALLRAPELVTTE